MELQKTKSAYEQIFKLLKKHKDYIVFDIENLEIKSKLHLFAVELKESFGLEIKPSAVTSLQWVSIDEFRKIGRFGSKYGRTISRSDDGSQPEDELLFYIIFSTGAYIFGDDYPTTLFKQFFEELKSYNPKYVDSANHGLYFPVESAKDIFNDFNSILKKYHEINKEDIKQRNIIKLKEQLARLES